MNDRLNFARRPFRDERPVFLAAALAGVAAAILLFANIVLYNEFHGEVNGTSRQIALLEERRLHAVRDAEQAQTALNSYRVSTLAVQSHGLKKLIGERRFSWTGLLARLERTLPADVRLARLTPKFDENGDTYLDLGLVGRSFESVSRTIEALSRDSAFGSVELRSEASQERGVPEGYSFDLSLHYRAQSKT
ncbi:MAG TPA: PilN domain-containing protein [Thermoanaerobaculia bacterium]|nr:PilN domain-containing protein [Thermoanaerobaculia bacterium]